MKDPDIERIEEAMDLLREHFDTVQVFCTRQDPDGTVNLKIGVGNWFARYGQIKDWVNRAEETAAIEARNNYEKDGE